MSFDSFLNSLGLGGREPPPPSRAPEPLGLRRGGFLSVDTTPFRMLREKMNFALTDCSQPIATRGYVDLNGNYLHRFYLDDDATWLQVKTDGGVADKDVSECILWQYWDTKTPANRDELKFIAGPDSPIGMPTYTVGDYQYERAWGIATGNTELIPFTEQVFDKNDTTPSFSCKHLSMLYRRQIATSDRQEYVIISVEESPDSLQVVTSIGIDVLRSDLSIT